MCDANSEREEKDRNITDTGEQFMLAHFSEMNQDLRHYDQRIETALNIYVAAWAFLLAGARSLYADTQNAQTLFKLVFIPSAILFTLGHFTVRRVVNSTISRDRRRAAANLIQHYFTLKNPDISPFLPSLARLPQPMRNVFQYPDCRNEDFDVSFPDGIVYFISTVNALLAGSLIASAGTWLFQAQNLWLLFSLAFITTFLFRWKAYMQVKNRYKQKKK